MKILIVEDDPMVGQINRKFALRLPFVSLCDWTDSIETAEAMLRENPYDLVLLDVYFPGGRGPDLLRWIRNEEIPVQVIFITADNSRATVERASHLGALDYLVKPFTFERFRAALEEAERRMSWLGNEGDWDQETIDRVFQKEEETSRPEDIDKGMSRKTYELILAEISRLSGTFTAEQLVERLGMARVTIRRYLDFMEKNGILEVMLKYGKVGRPQHFYRKRG